MARVSDLRDRLTLRTELTKAIVRRDGIDYWFATELIRASGMTKVGCRLAGEDGDSDVGGAGMLDKLYRSLERRGYLGNPDKAVNTPDGLLLTASGAEPLLYLLEGEFRAHRVGEVRTYLEERDVPLPAITASAGDTATVEDVARLVAEESATLRGEMEALTELLSDPETQHPVDAEQLAAEVEKAAAHREASLRKDLSRWVTDLVSAAVDERFAAMWTAANTAVSQAVAAATPRSVPPLPGIVPAPIHPPLVQPLPVPRPVGSSQPAPDPDEIPAAEAEQRIDAAVGTDPEDVTPEEHVSADENASSEPADTEQEESSDTCELTDKDRTRIAAEVVREHGLKGIDRTLVELLAKYGAPSLPQKYVPHHLVRDQKGLSQATLSKVHRNLRRLAQDGIVVETGNRNWALPQILKLAAD